ncbi:uncharacterized protein LOC125830728 [Solanum verrucosum]|uniref:uncharacterized protein LOC125830728 n=1 Tax=Solanum verrucosum TaxID=315347 RepID=UPI0020D0AE97|nr:uncharacterized protein LOC125830728 [Solanum verrucosum]
MEISNKMQFHGEKMNDVTIVEGILCSLTPKYEYVVCSIEESKDIDALSLDELQISLLVHEQKMTRSSTFEEQALKTFTFISSNSTGRGSGRGRGRGRGDRENKDGSRKFRVNDDYNKGRGRDFLTNPRLPNEKEEKSNFAENMEGETLLMAVHAKNEPTEQIIWYVDTGRSNHMTGSKYSFTDLNENFQSTVSFGDISTVNVMGKAVINFKTKNGCVETISNVFYIPALKSNLLSVSMAF